MNETVLIGAGGCMRELAWQIQEQNRRLEQARTQGQAVYPEQTEEQKREGQPERTEEQEQVVQQQIWHILGYVDRERPADGCGVMADGQQIPYLGDDTFLLERKQETNVFLCVGQPALRKKIAQKLKSNPHLHFPDLILSDTRISRDVRMGEGCIISMGVQISTNVVLGDFVFLNLGSGICHDGRIGNYVTFGPDVRAAGNVTVKDDCDLGMASHVIQGITIGEDTITGAGSVVIRDIPGHCTVAGVPAAVIKER